MKKSKKLWKVLGGILGVSAMLAIIPACVVSCSNSSSSSTTSTSSSSTTTSSTKTASTSGSSSTSTNSSKKTNSSTSSSSKSTNSTSSPLPTSITGTSFNDVTSNWNSSFVAYTKTTDYTNWMQANLQAYASNAPTYFADLANEYWSITNQQVPTGITNAYLPFVITVNRQYKMPTSISSLEAKNTNSNKDVTSSNSTSTPDTSTDNPTTVNGLPDNIIPNGTSGVPTGGTNSPMNQTMNIDEYLSLQSVALSDFSSSNNLFSFTLTWTYLNYTTPTANATSNASPTVPNITEATNLVKPVKMVISEKVVDATFDSTILGSISDLLNSKNDNVNVSAGWYLSSCKSNTYNQVNDLTSLTSQTNSDSTNSTNSVNDQNGNITVNDNNSNNQQNNKISVNNNNGTVNDNGQINNLQGPTSYVDPSTTSLLNAPVVTGFYASMINMLKDTLSTAGVINSSTMKTTVSTTGFSNNYWLSTFAGNGLAGYAYNASKDLINSANTIKNADTSLLTNLETNILGGTINIDSTINLPTSLKEI